MTKLNKSILIFSGFNQRAVIAFCRVMTKAKVPYAIIASGMNDTILDSAFSDRVFSIRKSKALDFNDIHNSIKKCERRLSCTEFVVAPSTEALNRFLLENHQALLAAFKIEIPLVDKKLYTLISDKKSFGELCQSFGLMTPAELEIQDVKQYPVVAKPKMYLSSIGTSIAPIIIQDEMRLDEFVKNEAVEDYYFQEYVGGKSFYLLYYFSRNGEVAKYSQQNLVQQSGGKSILAAISSDLHKTAISEQYELFFKNLGFTGFVMIELKEYSNKYYMIEANPRFWGPSQLLVDGKTNLFEMFLKDSGFEVETEQTALEGVRYFWFGGMIHELRRGNKLTYYNTTEEEINVQLQAWLQSDVYGREDTIRIFMNELAQET